jgi:hypothetical protein
VEQGKVVSRGEEWILIDRFIETTSLRYSSPLFLGLTSTEELTV